MVNYNLQSLAPNTEGATATMIPFSAARRIISSKVSFGIQRSGLKNRRARALGALECLRDLFRLSVRVHFIAAPGESCAPR